jgi:predicted RNase H-like HicB family nuclease
MHKIKLYFGEGGCWVAESSRYPEIVTKGRTKLEARAKFRKAVERVEKYLEKVESDPRFIKMMKRSEADIRAGRVHTQEEVKAILLRKRTTRKA